MSKALIVDDDGPIREIFKIQFEGRGQEVITAEDGKEGLAKAEGEVLDQIEAHESRCDAFVEKPIDPGRLFGAVERILK